MVALRSRGLGTVWTTMYLNEAPAVAELLELPDHVTQICLFPVAYTIGIDFTPTSRRYPAADIAYFDRYGRTKTPNGPAVVDEVDLKAKPDAVRAAIESLDTPPERWRFDVEQVPGGSRLRLHAPVDPDGDASTVMAEVRQTLEALAQQFKS